MTGERVLDRILPSETGVFLVHAVFVSTFAGLIGFAFLSLVLSESLTTRAYLHAENTVLQAEAVMEKAAWMLATPPSQNGWGIRMTTAPSGESIDEALGAGHFTELDGAKVIVQRTMTPWERRVSLVVEAIDGRISAKRVVQSLIHIDIAGERVPVDQLGGSALVMLDIPGGNNPMSTLVSTDLWAGSDSGSPALWVGHGRELSLWESTVSGDIWTHLPTTLDPWSSLTGDSLVVGPSGDHDNVFPELEPSAVSPGVRLPREEMFVIQKFAAAEVGSSLDAEVCSDEEGRLHVSLDGLGCGSDIDLLVDRWSEPPSDGVLAIMGDVTVDGTVPEGWIVMAAGSPTCSLPCGRLNYIARGWASGPEPPVAPEPLDSPPVMIGGSVAITTTTSDAVLTADVFSVGAIATGVALEGGGGIRPNLIIASTLIAGGAVRLGGPDHTVMHQGTSSASDAVEFARTGIRPKGSINSWKEVLPGLK